MNTDRIKEIQSKTAYPDSTSVQQALLQVWQECEEKSTILEDALKEISTEIICLGPGCIYCGCEDHPKTASAKKAIKALEEAKEK